MTDINNDTQKCYNSFSCILSVLIILFVVAAIGGDITVSKPEMRRSIEEKRSEVKGIHKKIDSQFQRDSIVYQQFVTETDVNENETGEEE